MGNEKLHNITPTMKEYLQSFLAKRNLQHPNGEMLYVYQMNKQEYNDLQAVLINNCKNHSICDLLKNDNFSRLFVLYAADWWKREYDGGVWSWDPIFSSITDEILKPHQIAVRTAAINSAFKYWKYNITLTTGKKYLGAIIANGGIPSKFLQTANQSPLVRVLSGVLRFASENNILNNDKELFLYTKNSAKKLPEVMRKDEICELITELVSTILKLKQEYKLQDVSNPITTLNYRCPNWKDRFPLLLEDAAVEKLLIGFVEKASRTKYIKGKVPLVNRFVDLNDEKELKFDFVFPEFGVQAEYFEDKFKVSNSNELPQTFYINATDENNTTIARVTSILGSVNNYKIHQFTNQLNVLNELSIYLYTPDNKINTQDQRLHLCQHIDITKPLVFTHKEDNIYVLNSNGSISLKEPECFIAYDKNILNLSDYTEFVDNIFVNDKELLFGKLTQDIELGDFIIKLNAINDSKKCLLQGTVLPYRTDPYTTYLDIPKVYYIDSDGNIQFVNKKYLTYYYHNTKQQLTNINTAYGIIDIYCTLNDIEQVFTVIVIPKNAKITLTSENDNRGSISIEEFNCIKITPINLPENIEYIKNGNIFNFNILNGKFPEKVCFKLNWMIGGFSYLYIPFPISGVSFFDEYNQQIDSPKFAIQHLLGKKIRIFNNVDNKAHYSINIEPRGFQHNASINKRIFIYDTITELKLIDFEENIKNLLSYSRNEDDFVKFSIKKQGKVLGTAYISRYDDNFVINGNNIGVSETSSYTNEQLIDTKVYAVELFGDDNKIELKQNIELDTATGLWNLSDIDIQNKVYMVISSKESAISFKPKILYTESSFQKLTDFSKYIIDNDDIDLYLHIDVNEHWNETIELLETFYVNKIPFTSIDLWQDICDDDKRLSHFLFKLQADTAIFQRLKKELLIVPATIPINVWQKAIEEYIDNQYNIVGNDEIVDILLDIQIKKIIETFPEIKVNIYYACFLLQKYFFKNTTKNCSEALAPAAKPFALKELKDEIFEKRTNNKKENNYSEYDEINKDEDERSWMQMLQAQNEMDEEDRWIQTTFGALYNYAYKNTKEKLMICSDHLFKLNNYERFIRDVVNFPQICAFFPYMIKNCDNSIMEKTKFSIKEFSNFNENYFTEVYKIASLIICHLLFKYREKL